MVPYTSDIVLLQMFCLDSHSHLREWGQQAGFALDQRPSIEKTGGGGPGNHTGAEMVGVRFGCSLYSRSEPVSSVP